MTESFRGKNKLYCTKHFLVTFPLLHINSLALNSNFNYVHNYYLLIPEKNKSSNMKVK